MKRTAMAMLAVGLLVIGKVGPAAAQSDEDQVRAVVQELFDAMRAADSTAVRGLFHPDLKRMATSGERDGKAGVAFGEIDGFVKAVGEAEPGAFDERIGPPDIRIDDHLATVVSPYAFYYNGNLSHCGVDVFLIARVGDAWRIVGLADTRRRDGCEEWLK